MYQTLLQSRRYSNGPNLARSYARYLDRFSPNYNSSNTGCDLGDSADIDKMARSLASGCSSCKTSGQVLIEQITVIGREFERDGRSRTRFAKVLESMRKLRKHNKGNNGNRKGNPNSDKEDLVEVEGMSRSFHGREPIEVDDVVQTIEYEDRLAVLADLLELGVLSSSGRHIITILFNKDKPRLTCNADGTNLELVGGDQRLSLDSMNSDISEGKDLIPIGFDVSIAYETDKHHLEGSNGKIEAYEHYFGEEFYKGKGYSGGKFFERALEDGVVHEASKKGILPMLVYDCRNERILFVGGKYKVEDVGIRD